MMVQEALASWKIKAVKAAMEEEIRSLVGTRTWELVERPPGVSIVKNRWVLTTKYHIEDTVEREKARLVMKGFTQVYGASNDETYVLVSSYVTLRIFLSIVAVLDLNLMQLDMKNAFLQSKLDRVLYMYQPDYFNDGTGQVCKLLKSLYGLKQSPLLWYRALDSVLLGAGWKKSHVDMVLYFKVGDDKVTCWVLVYVDDLLAATSDAEGAEAAAEGRLRAAGNLASAGLHWAGDRNRRTPKTPVSVDAYATLPFDDEEAQVHEEEEYRQKVDLLQFAATRPDITFACSKLRSGPTVTSDQHWCEFVRYLTYLANTCDTALEFGGGAESLKLVGYMDDDDAGNKQNRTSTGGYVFIFGGATVSLVKPVHQMRNAIIDRVRVRGGSRSRQGGTSPSLPPCKIPAAIVLGALTVLHVDNDSAIIVAEGMGLTRNLKHMERRQAWLQRMVKRGKFSLRYILTDEQPADFLTKVLHYPTFNRCSVAIGQVRLVDVGDGDNNVQQ
ncbi:unnamed protein product [Closterium sp. NIES-54]